MLVALALFDLKRASGEVEELGRLYVLHLQGVYAIHHGRRKEVSYANRASVT